MGEGVVQGGGRDAKDPKLEQGQGGKAMGGGCRDCKEGDGGVPKKRHERKKGKEESKNKRSEGAAGLEEAL